MEYYSNLASSPEWAIMSILTLIFLLVIFKKLKNPTQNLPPGPWRLPLIGSMHHLIGCLPHQKMRDLSKKHGPIMHLQLGEITTIIVSSAETAEQVLKTHDLNFAQRPQVSAAKSISYGYKDITFSPYGDYWRQLRKISAMELLANKRVESFRSIREEETSKMIELIRVASGSAINLSRMVSSLTYWITSRTAFGKIWEGEDEVVEGVEKMMIEVGKGISIVDSFPSLKFWIEMFSPKKTKVEQLQEQLDKTIQRILNQHRSARLTKSTTHASSMDHKEDLIDVLLNLQENGDYQFPITDLTIKALIMDTFIGGVDTSATTLEWTMSQLVKHPKVMEKAQAELRYKYSARGTVVEADLHEFNYLHLVIKESFRLHPPAPLLAPRECLKSCVIGGYEIPIKSRILVNAYAMGRDHKYWDDPEEFKPERFIDSPIDYKGNSFFGYVPFGAGRRICPGVAFGLANIDLPLAQLLYHFDWKLADGIKLEDLDMSEEMGVTTKRKSNLFLIPTPYLPPTN